MRPEGVTYRFTGNYENQIRSTKRMMIVLPLALFVIFLILYFQFKSAVTTLLVFTGIFVAWSGGFQMLWLYGQDWFLNFPVFGNKDSRENKQEGIAEVNVVEQAQAYLKRAEEEGQFVRPEGVTYRFTGNYENQIRSTKRMMIVLPLALFVIFLILYFQFKSAVTTLLVFTGIFVAWSGGFQMLWLYGQDWFLNFPVFGENLRDIFHVRPYNLSVAVWVGFLALFGIATDDGVILTTDLNQTFARRRPKTKQEIREAVVEAGKRRIRPCLMTVATTILALIPVLTSIGRGADVMVPMAIPSFGGMTVVLITVFTVPTLYCLKEEWRQRFLRSESGEGEA